MRRSSIAVVLAVAACLAVPAAAPAAGFSLGVAAGEVTSSSALLWAHATASGPTTLEVARSRTFRNPVAAKRVTAARSHDNTVQARVTRLAANTAYYFRWVQGTRRSSTGKFRTAPSPASNASVRFAWSGDADAQPQSGQRRPFWNSFETYRSMQRENNAFNVNLGDTIYSDTEVGAQQAGGVFRPVVPTAKTTAAKWAKYRMNLAQANLSNLRGAAAMYNHWDDHEFINDFTRSENGAAIYQAGVRAFRDYMPVSYGANGIYRSARWGRNLEVFFLDERSFRSAKASRNGQCDDSRGNPDLGPTAPQSTRNTFAAIYPPLSQPVKPGCVQAINDPGRTMLGSRQYATFTAALKRSTATFKVVMNEVPIQQFYALPYDRWEGYASERRRLMDYIASNQVKNVVFLTTDVHATFVNTIKFSTLGEEGPPVDTNIFDITTGPVATKNFHLELSDALGSEGSANIFRAIVEKGGPPNGVAMKCAVDNQFSYGQVSVTGSALTVNLKDSAGRPLREPADIGGGPCGPFTIPKQ
jgi:phosphodiesterase/alkaline phosphatase D-like protein